MCVCVCVCVCWGGGGVGVCVRPDSSCRVSMCAAQFTFSMLVEMFLKPASFRKVRHYLVSDIAD